MHLARGDCKRHISNRFERPIALRAGRKLYHQCNWRARIRAQNLGKPTRFGELPLPERVRYHLSHPIFELLPSDANDSRNSGGNPVGPEHIEVAAMKTNSINLTDHQLIRLAADGDARAIRSLYDRYSPRVYAVVRRIAGDDDLAEDYAQEAWIRAIRALPTFRGDARFSTWLHRIAVNAALQALRKAETREKREAPVVADIAIAPAPSDSLLQKRLEGALDGLPEGMRRVLILHDVEGYTHEEIGDVLGVTAGTSKSQLFKARAKMRVMLAGLDGAAQEHGAEAWSI